MSYDYRYSRQQTTRPPTTARRRAPLPPPPPQGRGGNSSNTHGILTYWLPLVVTGSIALGGLAAWVWSEHDHSNYHDDGYPDDKPPRPSGSGRPPPGSGGGPGVRPPSQQQQQGPPPSGPLAPGVPAPQRPLGGGPGEAASYYDQSQQYRSNQQTTSTSISESRDVNSSQQQQQQEDGTWYGRVTGLMKRSPSPQQLLDGATKSVSSGMAAAGGYLGQILEDGSEDELVQGGRRYDGLPSASGNVMGGKSKTGMQERRVVSTESREGFSDHERWSEEAEEQDGRVGIIEADSDRKAESARSFREGTGKGRARKAVAVVVSAAEPEGDQSYGEEDDLDIGHASLLSHLSATNTTNTTLFILLYCPSLKTLPPLSYRPNLSTPHSPTSEALATPGSELQSISPRPSSPTGAPTGAPTTNPGSLPLAASDPFNPPQKFASLYSRALALTNNTPSQILPFTTQEGYIHILRHLAPALVYVSDTLAGPEGSSVGQLKGWVGHTVLVAGEGGTGGLVDTETETETEAEQGARKGAREGARKGGRTGEKGREGKWYERSEFVGLGKDVEVVDAGRFGEDWARRVGGLGRE